MPVYPGALRLADDPPVGQLTINGIVLTPYHQWIALRQFIANIFEFEFGHCCILNRYSVIERCAQELHY
jgi:hypothetical protein